MADEVVIEEEEKAEASLLNADTAEEQEDGEVVSEESKADANGDESSKEKPKEEDSKGAPDEYKDFTTPEGFGELDPVALEQFAPVAKELDFSQSQAQGVVDLYGKLTAKAAESQHAQWAETLKTWKADAVKDDEIGGAVFQTTVVSANKAIDVFGNEKLREVLDTTGMGNNVEVIRMFSKIGQALKDDNVVFGKGTGDSPKSHEAIMYPDMNQGAD